jgi:hypothetical protein
LLGGRLESRAIAYLDLTFFARGRAVLRDLACEIEPGPSRPTSDGSKR